MLPSPLEALAKSGTAHRAMVWRSLGHVAVCITRHELFSDQIVDLIFFKINDVASVNKEATMDATPQSLPSVPHYLLDGELFSLSELLSVNDLGGDEVVRLRNLLPGHSLAIGSTTLMRIPAKVAP